MVFGLHPGIGRIPGKSGRFTRGIHDESSIHDVNVWCTLYNREADGTLFKMQDRFLPASTNTGWTTLTFDSLPAVDNGYHLLVCRFPARLGSQNTGITSYSVTEDEES